MLDELLEEFKQVRFGIRGHILSERFEFKHLLLNFVFFEGHEFVGKESFHIFAYILLLFELSGIHGLNNFHEVNLLVTVGRHEEVEQEIAEVHCSFSSILIIQILRIFVNGVVHDLVSFCSFKDFLLVDIVGHHIAVVLNFHFFKSLLRDSLSADLS